MLPPLTSCWHSLLLFGPFFGLSFFFDIFRSFWIDEDWFTHLAQQVNGRAKQRQSCSQKADTKAPGAVVTQPRRNRFARVENDIRSIVDQGLSFAAAIHGHTHYPSRFVFLHNLNIMAKNHAITFFFHGTTQTDDPIWLSR